MGLCFIGSAAPAKITVASKKEAQELLDEVSERCSMTYRAPELFNIDIDSVIDERIDIWVSYDCLLIDRLLMCVMASNLFISRRCELSKKKTFLFTNLYKFQCFSFLFFRKKINNFFI